MMLTDAVPIAFSRRVPDGDALERRVCNTCGFVDYENPKIVVGAVVSVGAQVLLCRRAIEPRHGYWTIPAGFMEQHESVEDGIKREAWEEAEARLTLTRLLAIYSIPRISQVQILHLAELAAPGFAPGPESLEVALFDWDRIPWDDLAFPSVHWALRHARAMLDNPTLPPFSNPPGDRGDAHP
jgi:ADP-ribose pyrophosphatase YjhB (NUDIX family)